MCNIKEPCSGAVGTNGNYNMSNIDVYIVAGENDVGKTTTIKHIVSGAKKWHHKYAVLPQITNNNSTVDVFYKTQSLQEAKIKPTDIDTIPKFNQKFKITKIPAIKNISAIIVALRTDSACNGFVAKQYIDIFVNQLGWNIKYVAELLCNGANQPTTLGTYYSNNNIYNPFTFCPLVSNLSNKCAAVKTFFGF